MAGLVPERINTSGHRGGSRAEHHAGERSLPPRVCAAPQVCEAFASPEARGAARCNGLGEAECGAARRAYRSILRREAEPILLEQFVEG